MKEINLLYLSQEDIKGLNVSWPKMISLIERVFMEHSKGAFEMPPKPGIHPKKDAFIHAMPGYLRELNICGIKWISGFTSNHKIGTPQITGVLVLNDTNTGVPIALMDARWITAVRTSIVSAITAKYCAKIKSSTLGIIGAGVQGMFHTIALSKILPDLATVKIFDKSKDSLNKFKNTISSTLDIKIKEVEKVEKVVNDTDIVLTATGRLKKPIIKYSWLKDGVLGIGLESGRAWGEVITSMDRFITDDWQQTKSFMEEGAYPEGIQDNYTELGDIISNEKPARKNNNEKIFAGNLGISVADIAIAHYIYKLAQEKSIGLRLPLMQEINLI